MSSFTKSFIIKSIISIFVVFLTIYFLFNRVVDNFIRNEVEPSLSVQTHNILANNVAIFNGGWETVSIEDATRYFLDLSEDTTPLDSLALAIFSDTSTNNHLMLNHRYEIAISENAIVDKQLALTDYYIENKDLFQIGETVSVYIEDRIFYMRSVATDHVEDARGNRFEFPPPPYPLTILFYTEVTAMINFKNTVNHILLVALSISGLIFVGVTLSMSSKFKQSIIKLANYAEKIGHGSFDAEIAELKYSEFQTLANSMTEMSTMLATYEANQKQFFQNASHELRTPLMAIQCYSEGILADVFQPNEAANIIKNEVEKMTDLVSSILYLSRINHHTTQPEPISIHQFLTRCCEQIKFLADNNHITISFNPLNQDVQLNIDYQLFERAVLNILTNALRYAKKEISITLKTRLERNIFDNIKRDKLIIYITNDGPPISEKDLPYIFDRFYKGHDGNTGIGLAITKEIIANFDGNIHVQNLDQGVCFMIEMPVYIQEETI